MTFSSIARAARAEETHRRTCSTRQPPHAAPAGDAREDRGQKLMSHDSKTQNLSAEMRTARHSTARLPPPGQEAGPARHLAPAPRWRRNVPGLAERSPLERVDVEFVQVVVVPLFVAEDIVEGGRASVTDGGCRGSMATFGELPPPHHRAGVGAGCVCRCRCGRACARTSSRGQRRRIRRRRRACSCASPCGGRSERRARPAG